MWTKSELLELLARDYSAFHYIEALSCVTGIKSQIAFNSLKDAIQMNRARNINGQWYILAW